MAQESFSSVSWSFPCNALILSDVVIDTAFFGMIDSYLPIYPHLSTLCICFHPSKSEWFLKQPAFSHHQPFACTILSAWNTFLPLLLQGWTRWPFHVVTGNLFLGKCLLICLSFPLNYMFCEGKIVSISNIQFFLNLQNINITWLHLIP